MKIGIWAVILGLIALINLQGCNAIGRGVGSVTDPSPRVNTVDPEVEQ